MKIFLTAATPAEIGPTLEWLMGLEPTQERNLLRFPTASVAVCFTGVGPMRTAFALGSSLRENDLPHLAIQAGVAGAFDRNLELGQVVNVRSDRLIDDGAEDRDGTVLSLAEIGFPYAAPFGERGELMTPATNAILPFTEVTGGTASRATGSPRSIERIRERYPDVQTESMEGAAFMYACLAAGAPALQLRSISNYVAPRDRSSWELMLAIENLNRALRQVLAPFLKFE